MLLCQLNGQKDEMASICSSPTITSERGRYYDPRKLMRKPYDWNPEFNWPIWFFVERSGRTVAVTMANWDVVIDLRSGRHSTKPISYFNTMALLYHMCDDGTISGRDLLSPGSSTLLMALSNVGSRDMKTIELRKKLFDTRWIILTGADYLIDRLKSSLVFGHN